MSAEDNSEVDPATPESDQVEADQATEDLDQTEDEPTGARRGSGFWALLAAVLLVAIILLILLTQCVPRVPDVVGLSQKQATIKLEDSGYALGEVSKIELPDVSPGKVAEQAPPAGAVFGRGKSVDLIVALGADVTKVPDVIGNDTPAAQLLITGQDLVMEITGAYSDTIPAGAIISQSPPPGAEVPVGSTVVVVVSLGSAPDTEFGSRHLGWRRAPRPLSAPAARARRPPLSPTALRSTRTRACGRAAATSTSG